MMTQSSTHARPPPTERKKQQNHNPSAPTPIHIALALNYLTTSSLTTGRFPTLRLGDAALPPTPVPCCATASSCSCLPPTRLLTL